MKFRKYEFLPEEWATLKDSIQVNNLFDKKELVSYNQDLIVSVVEIGHIMITPPVIGEDLEVIENAVLSDKYSVDILWKDEPLESFESYEIWCEPIGTHSFGSDIDADYINEYKARQ